MAQLQRISDAQFTYPREKRIGHNTYASCHQQSMALRYHRTTVVQYDAHLNTLRVDPAGWFTKTTAERIRHGLAFVGLQLWTNDLPGRWRVVNTRTGEAWTIRGSQLVLYRTEKGWQRIE